MKSQEQENIKKTDPTKSELEILQMIWEYGPCNVRLVNNKLNEQGREVNYTTTLKLMQIMVEKGILLRDESQMKHIYRAAEDESKTKDHLLNRFINTMYNGSASKLMMQLLGNKKASKEELEELKNLIKDLEKNSK